MKQLPFSLKENALRQFIDGRCTRFRYPADGHLARAECGWGLWIREPFHLDADFDGIAPTKAAERGVRPVFAIDLQPGEYRGLGLGRSRAAYTLPRAWHRQHALIASIEHQSLDEITDEEARLEGFGSRGDWIEAWDRSIRAISGAYSPRLFKNRPTVLVLTLNRTERPLRLPEPIGEAA